MSAAPVGAGQREGGARMRIHRLPHPHEAPRRAAILLRTGTSGPAAQSQRAALEALAADRGYAVARVYEDGGPEGPEQARPAVVALLDDAERGAYEVLLLSDADPLEQAEPWLHHYFTGELAKNGVSIETESGPVSAAAHHGSQLEAILAAIADFERRHRPHKAAYLF
jgi:DNA invertase Pin-like site-specific DNA recombinase